jgi:hypothetical protein
MHDAEGCDGDLPDGSGVTGDQRSGHPGGGHSGDILSGRPRGPYRDPLDPRGSLAAGIYVLSVLAIIIALGIFFISGG